jgi:sensor histidine kinase regulating citrate/malate metabolism
LQERLLRIFIEEILSEGRIERVSTFLLKMVGLRRDIQLVGTLENVRDTDKVHDYLRANNMANYTKEVQKQIHKFLIKITANFIFFVDRPVYFI